jgi:hypothetical protein
MLQRNTDVPYAWAQSSILWANEKSEDTNNPYWLSDRLRTVLVRHSERLLGIPLNISSFRQIAIVIDRDILRTAMDLRTQDGDDDSGNEQDGCLDEHDGQAGHSTRTARLHYGVVEGELESLDPTLFARYRKVSQAWHTFMGLGVGQDTHSSCPVCLDSIGLV